MNLRHLQFPATAERVKKHTPAVANRRIQRDIERNVTFYAVHPDRIDERLEELDREWDIERTLEANASTLTVIGVVLGGLVSRRFLVLPGGVAGFLLQHALQGWCPPVPLFRRLGIRTADEIDRERYALKYLRGDFGDKPPGDAPAAELTRQALAAVDNSRQRAG